MKNAELYKSILGSVYTNCYFLKNKSTGEVLIVDPADEAEKIFEKVNEISGTPKAVLLTHGHFDHIQAVEGVRQKYHIPVYAQREEAKMLLDASLNLSGNCGRISCSIEADTLLSDLQVFEAAGFSVQVIHTPGHTEGSCCYYIEEENLLFSGDTLFYGSVGRTDLPGGSMGEIVRSLHKLVDSLPEETEVYPGHDTSTTIGYEKRYNPFV